MSQNKFQYAMTEYGGCAVYASGENTEETLVFPTEMEGHPVIEIGKEACFSMDSLRTVIVPEGVKTIHRDAFYQCKNLTHIHLPTTLTTLNKDAIVYCDNLAYITCPRGAASLQDLVRALNLPAEKKVLTQGGKAGETNEEGKIGVYTACTVDEEQNEILYQKAFVIRVAYYDPKQVAKWYEEAEGYSLKMMVRRTYDVYSSDGVSNDDEDKEENLLSFKPTAIVVKDDAFYGVFYEQDGFSAVLCKDGTAHGDDRQFSRRLCYGHPLDYYMNTRKTLMLEAK